MKEVPFGSFYHPNKEGKLRIQTELGRLVVEPGELAVIPQNIR